MQIDLYTVFERPGESVGISEFGDCRTFIYVSGEGKVGKKQVQLHELGPHIAALNRSGFSQTFSQAYFNESEAKFTARHSDFESNDYLVFVRPKGDVSKATARIEAIALSKLKGEQRTLFNDWLRGLDLSSNYFVAPSNDPAPVLALCEYAHEQSLRVMSALPDLPTVKPSAAKQSWLNWLSKRFEMEVLKNTYSSIWPDTSHQAMPVRTPVQASAVPADPFIFI